MADKLKAKEVNEIIFMERLETQIRIALRAIEVIEGQIREYKNMYFDITKDKINYNLKYYVIEEGLTFERNSKKKIGF